MSTKEKTKAKKAEIKLTDIQSGIVRKFEALSTKGADAYNGLTGFCQSTMEASVLFTDGYGWSDEAIEDLNTTLKAMQSKLERKSTGYATFASAKSTILKALRAGVADVRKPKDELAAETKKLTTKPESESESESGSKSEITPAMLIQQALDMLVQSGDTTPVKTAQGLLILAGNNLKKKK
jgi:hypothetical protein